MAFTVVYDACVLYPAPRRDLLLRVAMTGVVRARWSDAILDECFRSILEQRPDLEKSALHRTRGLMTQAIPDCLIPNAVRSVRVCGTSGTLLGRFWCDRRPRLRTTPRDRFDVSAFLRRVERCST